MSVALAIPYAGAVAGAVVASAWQASIVAALSVLLAQVCTTARGQNRIELAGLLTMGVVFVRALLAGASRPIVAQPSYAADSSWIADALVLVYAAGFAVVAIRTLRSVGALVQLRRTLRPLPAAWESRLALLCDAIGHAPAGGFAQSDALESAAVFGWVRPIVVLPVAWLARLEPLALEAIVLHELEHARRFDVLAGYVQAGALTLLWFHPLAWWLSARIRRSREYACDDAAAVRVGGHPMARALLDAETLRTDPPLGVMQFWGVRGSGLAGRIGRLVKRPRKSFVRRFGVALAPAVLAVAGLLAHALLPGPARAKQLQIPWLPAAVQSWEPQIVTAARQHGVDPELLAIVMLVESWGNAGATSPVGARGLVQVMPSTAADVATRRGLEPPHPFGLYDPVINLDYGAWYLASQLQTFEHDGDAVELAAAAYNGGPGRVRAWLRGQGSLPAETRRYKELVAALYRERRDPESPTFTALARRRSFF